MAATTPEWLTITDESELTPETITEMWNSYVRNSYDSRRGYYNYDKNTFINALYNAFGIKYEACWGCDEWNDIDEMNECRNERHICESCTDHDFTQCPDCMLYSSNYDMHSVGDRDEMICEYCIEDGYQWCEHCDRYFANDDEHDFSHSCDCESPALQFRIRNDGLDLLENDTRATIELPVGIISETGIRRISNTIANYGYDVNSGRFNGDVHKYYNVPFEMEAVWQNRQGNFTKRFSSAVYQASNKTVRVPADLLSKIGVIATENTSKQKYAHIETTRRLNMSARHFHHGGSCWWNGYQASRCCLKNNGGFGIRSFNNEKAGVVDELADVTGRCWVLPLKRNPNYNAGGYRYSTDNHTAKLIPTFDTENADAFMVFNGYGALDGFTPVRILAHMLGMTYKKIGDFNCEPMYVNSGGYLLSSQDILDDVDSLYLQMNEHAGLFASEQTHFNA